MSISGKMRKEHKKIEIETNARELMNPELLR